MYNLIDYIGCLLTEVGRFFFFFSLHLTACLEKNHQAQDLSN